MRVGVLGTGSVGKAIGTKLVELGHEVTMGSRTADNLQAVEWAGATGERAAHGTFADAAVAGELLFNCTAGTASLEALRAAGEENLAGKVLIDVSNALDFSQGMPPILAVCNIDSVGEQIQRFFPEARVVKALNTVNHEVMVDPGKIQAEHDLFVCGNDDAAKNEVARLLESFGWPAARILDLGDISASRGMEMYLPLWVRLVEVVGGPNFNIKVAV
jgi:8-hydroxy-5-deazaflavin:NADPH oxidoreductase